MIVFMGGIALPLLTAEFGLGDVAKGAMTSSTLAGILVGALVLGGLADRFGRKPVFIGEMVLLLVALIGASTSPGIAVLVVWLFVIGLALGADYPTAHLVISESIPASIRGRLVLGAFSFQAIGAIAGTAIAAVVLAQKPELSTWRLFYLLPVILVIWGRLFLPESSHWLVSQWRHEKAEKQLRKLLNRRDIDLLRVEIADQISVPKRSNNFAKLFQSKQRRRTLLASLPWFLQDLSTYGIGIFTPVIIAAAFGAKAGGVDVASIIHDDLIGAKGTALIDIGFLVGISVAIYLADR